MNLTICNADNDVHGYTVATVRCMVIRSNLTLLCAASDYIICNVNNAQILWSMSDLVDIQLMN